ncbi:glycerate kinase [Leeuwenhoekiella polynyae]|uniref:glycerate kinase family protein n=1 Tax=Leeuwenhoekiella polynyae TaxID=1550906 RepID=UPI001F0BD6DF
MAPDSFKESLTATQVCEAIAAGIRSVNPYSAIDLLPFSDGGEGAFELFDALKLGAKIECDTFDPLRRSLKASYYGFKDGKTAWVELSQASGLALLKDSEKNPLLTSTYGTGLQINHALDNGFTTIILGIGGSATHDLGTGIFEALGGKLLDPTKNSLHAKGEHLARCTELDFKNLNTNLRNATSIVACDVTNTLLGKTGAAYTYAPQKGASPAVVAQLEEGATHFAKLVQQKRNKDLTQIKGGGAAGGTAAGMFGLFDSALKPGFDLLSDLTALEERVREADLLITGEGKTDNQSQYGKVPFKLAELAKKYHKPLLLFAGSVSATPEILTRAGITAAYAIKTETMTLDYAKTHAYSLLKDAVLKNLKNHI